MPKKSSSNNSKPSIPENWPSHAVYLTQPVFSKYVPRSLLQLPSSASTSKQSITNTATTANNSSNVFPHKSNNHSHNTNTNNNNITDPSLLSAPLINPSPSTPYTNIQIRPINQETSPPTHPAQGQHGLFTTRLHPPGSLIVLYQGYIHANADFDNDPTSDYDLSLDRELILPSFSSSSHPHHHQRDHDKRGSLHQLHLGEKAIKPAPAPASASASASQTPAPTEQDKEQDDHVIVKGVSIDATKSGNEARFINDYRGIKPGPNAEFKDCWVLVEDNNSKKVPKKTTMMERRVGVFVCEKRKDGFGGNNKNKAKRDGGYGGGNGGKWEGIQKGEEVLVSYGRGFWCHRTNTTTDDVELDHLGGDGGGGGVSGVSEVVGQVENMSSTDQKKT